MTNVPHRATFETAYAGTAPWDIGRPYGVFTAVVRRSGVLRCLQRGAR